jgi:hypothetical protein
MTELGLLQFLLMALKTFTKQAENKRKNTRADTGINIVSSKLTVDCVWPLRSRELFLLSFFSI